MHIQSHIESQITMKESEPIFSDEKLPDVQIFINVHMY